MMKLIRHLEKNLFTTVLLPALLLTFFFLLLRNSGIYPVVFIDEWTYSSNARLMPLADAQVPSYLYFSLFKLTSVCGDSFFDCNRLLNTALFVLAAPFIYLLAKRVVPGWLAALIALAAVFSPNNVYTPFFMPEAMYFCAFWVYSWVAFAYYDRPTPALAALLGAVLGAMAMVKVHALFLLPSLCIFLLYVGFDGRMLDSGSGWRWLRRALAMAVIAVAAALALRLAVGYLLAGRAGLSLFGRLYAEQAAYTSQSHYPLPRLLALAWHNLQGHLVSIAVLFGVPLAALAGALHLQARSVARALTVYSVLVLGSLLALTVLFTASITGLAVGDTAARIHTRYYNFALPLMLLSAAGLLYAPAAALKLRWRLLLGTLVLGLIAWGRLHFLTSFAPAMIDSAEMRAFSVNHASFNVIAGMAVVAVLLWMWHQRSGLRVFLYLCLPVSTLICAINTAREVRLSIYADAYSKAGLFARHYLSREQSDHLTVVAPEIGGLLRTRFFIENPNVAFMETPRNASNAEWLALPAGTKLVLAIGHYVPPLHARIIADKDDMLLFEPGAADPTQRLLKFSLPLDTQNVQRAEGLATIEPWGRWTMGPQARIEFAAPLPKKMTLRLTGRAFGPNAGKDVLVTVGDQQQVLRWSAQSSQTELHFETSGTAHAVNFAIPAPTAPKSLGQNSDTRELGIALELLSVDDLDKPTTDRN